MFELKVAMSQSWRKRVDFPYLKIFQIFLQKWPIMSCILAWSSIWNLLMTKKDGMKYTSWMTFLNLNNSKYPKIERVMKCWSWQIIMKWPIIFCILKATSINFLTFHIKEGIKFTSSRSLWKSNGLKVIKISRYDHLKSHMENWGFIWRTCNLSSSLSLFLVTTPWNFWSDLLITL